MSAKWSTPSSSKHPDCYHDKVWFDMSSGIDTDLCILTRHDGSGYWVSQKNDREGIADIGPFDTLEAAQAAYETMK